MLEEQKKLIQERHRLEQAQMRDWAKEVIAYRHSQRSAPALH